MEAGETAKLSEVKNNYECVLSTVYLTPLVKENLYLNLTCLIGLHIGTFLYYSLAVARTGFASFKHFCNANKGLSELKR